MKIHEASLETQDCVKYLSSSKALGILRDSHVARNVSNVDGICKTRDVPVVKCFLYQKLELSMIMGCL